MGIYSKNVFLGILLFCIVFILISGCVVPKPKYCGEGLDKHICGYTPNLETVSNACKAAAKMPEGYVFCKTKSECEKLFNSKIPKNQEYIDQFSEFYLSQSKQALIDSWLSANNATEFIAEARKSCDDIFGLLKSANYNILTAKEQVYTKNMTLFKKNYSLQHKYMLMNLYYLKTYLTNQNIRELADTKLFGDYEQLNDIINNYDATINLDINISKSILEEDAKFYTKYFGENNINIHKLFSESSAYSKCIAESDGNVEYCYIKEYIEESKELNEDVLEYMLGSNLGLTGFVSGAILFMSYPVVGQLLTKAIFSADYVGNWTKNLLETFRGITDIDEWKEVSYGKEVLEDFEVSHGPNSKIFEYYIFVNKVAIDLRQLNQELESKQKTLNKQILELKTEALLQQKFYLENKILYSKFRTKSANLDYLNVLNYYEKQLLILNNETQGVKYREYNIIEKNLANLSANILESSVNESYFVLQCDNYFKLNLSKVKILDKEQIERYGLEYNSIKSNKDKLAWCSSVISLYDSESTSICEQMLSNLDIKYSVVKNENNCRDALADVEETIKESNDYSEINLAFSELEKYYSYLYSIKQNTICIKSNEFATIDKFIFDFETKYNYLDDILVETIMRQDSKKVLYELNSYLSNAKDLFNKNLSCYFAQNYYFDKDKIIFQNPFGIQKVNFELDLELSDYFNSINKTGCLKLVDFKDKYVKFVFNCLDENMLYFIKLNNVNYSQQIKMIYVTLDSAKALQEYCFANIIDPELIVPLPFNANTINNISVYYDTKQIPSEISNNELLISWTFNNPKNCIDVYYDLTNPVEFDYDISVEKLDFNSLKYSYALRLTNTLNYELTNLLLYFPSSGVVLKDKTKVYDNVYREYDLKQIYDKFVINIDKIYSKEEISINFELSNNYSEDDFYDTISKIISDLSEYIETPDTVLKEKIIKLIENLTALKNDPKNIVDKYKELSSLEKDAESLINKAESISVLDNKYLDLKKTLALYKDKHQIYYAALNSEFSDYFAASDADSVYKLETVLSDAESYYLSGNVKQAISLLETYNKQNGLGKAFVSIFNNLKSSLSDLIKDAKRLNLNLITKKVEQEKHERDVLSALSVNDPDAILGKLRTYKEFSLELKNRIDSEVETRINLQKRIILIYEQDANELDQLLQICKQVVNGVNSDSFDQIISFGVKFSQTKKFILKTCTDLNILQNKKEVFDKIISDYSLVLLQSKIDAIVSFDFDEISVFVANIEKSKSLISAFYKELEQSAKYYLNSVEDKFGNNLPVEYYKSKESYDNKQYINSIYYAKTALLTLPNTNSSTSSSWIIGIVFILLLFFIFVKYKSSLNKFMKKREKRTTYYTVDKDD